MKFIKDRKIWLSISVLVILLLAAYIPNFANAGYIGDDWISLFVVKQKGPSNLYYHHASDRPLRGYHSIFLTRLLDTKLHLYQITGLAFRLFDTIFVLLIFMLIWPKRWFTNLMIASLTLIFPCSLWQNQIYFIKYILTSLA